MFIAIDIGNSNTVLGIYEKKNLIFDRRLESLPERNEDDLCNYLASAFKETVVSTEKIDGVAISSVVPDLTDKYSRISVRLFHQEPLIVNYKLELGIKIHYDDPSSVGADRLCDAVAGYAKYGGPLIIIDFGTATTYDVVASNGDFLGGIIAPGIATSAANLHRRTAKLPSVELRLPDKIICTDTESSIQAGILWGAMDSMVRMVDRIQNELHSQNEKKAVIIATGGFSKFIAEHSKTIQHLEPYLVLEGIRLIYERVKLKK